MSKYAEALALLPDDSDMIEHNPDEGMRLFCCYGEVNDGYQGIAGVTHTSDCWYIKLRALLNEG